MVYNIETDVEHTYYVQTGHILAHNACPGLDEDAVSRWENEGGRTRSELQPAAQPPEAPSRLPRYEGPKPSYVVNPQHVRGSLKRGKEVLPPDAEEVYRTAVPSNPETGGHWFGKNADGTIYRFSNGNDGTAHFSGSDASPDGIRNITPYAKKRLNGE